MKINSPQKLIHKGLALVAITIFFEIIFVCVLGALLKQANIEIERQAQSRSLVAACDALSKNAYRAIEATLSYHTTHATKYKQDCDRIMPVYKAAVADLAAQIGDRQGEPITQDKLTRDGRLLETLLAQAIEKPATSLSGEDFFNGTQLNRNVIRAVNALSNDLDVLVQTEQQKMLAKPPNIERKVAVYLLIGLILNIIIAVTIALWLTRGTARRLDTLMENTFRFGNNQSLLERLGGDDEIAKLDEVFHLMAESVKEANRKTRSIVQNSVDVICSLDAQGRFLSVNRAVQATWGYSAEELISRFVLDIISQQDRVSMQDWLKNSIQEALTSEHECVLVTKDGKPLNILWSGYWSASDGALICVAHNFTERKKYEQLLKDSEQHLNLLVQQMPVGVVAFDRTGAIRITNAAIEKLFGYASSSLQQTNISQLLTHETASDEFLRQLNDNPESGGNCELRGLKRTGQKFPIRVTPSRIESKDGALFLLNVVDISEEKRAEQLRREITAMATHDLRSPLTSLQSFLELLGLGRYGQLTDLGNNRLSLVERNVEFLVKLINDLLDVDKLESGIVHLSLEEVQPAELIAASVESVLDLAEKLEVEIVQSVSTAKAHRLDKLRMTQVVVNLLSNALHHSPSHSKVVITAEADGECLSLKITDEGPGIAEEFQGAIFERFQQIQTTKSKASKSTGLGLAIAKAIVELHGGQIGVDSRVSEGSCFWLKLPTSR